MKKAFLFKLFFSILLVFILFSCNFSNSEENKKAINDSDTATFEMVKDALHYMISNEMDSLSEIVHMPWQIRDGSLQRLMDSLQMISRNSYYSVESTILLSDKPPMLGKRKIQGVYTIPFRGIEDSDEGYFVAFTIMASGKIGKIELHRNLSEWELDYSSQNELKGELMAMKVQNVDEFKVWYESGFLDRAEFHGRNYYMIKGDISKIDEVGLTQDFCQLFDLINNAQVDSKDNIYPDSKEEGNPESITLTFRFNGNNMTSTGEFVINTYFEQEKGMKEIMSDYIWIRLPNKTRILYLKSKNAELFDKLHKIAYRRYKQEDYDGL